MLDYIMVGRETLSLISKFKIAKEEDILTSDHLPIVMCTCFPYTDPCDWQSLKNHNTHTLAWNKVTDFHIFQYQRELAQTIHDLDASKDNPNDIYTKLIKTMLNLSDTIIPKSKFNQFTKPYWTSEVKQKHTLSRYYRRIWIREGRPRGPNYTSYTNYKKAKAEFRYIQRVESENYLNQIYYDLDEAADLDYRLFWKLLKRGKKSPSAVPFKIVVDDISYEDQNVSNGFAEYYEDIFQAENANNNSEYEIELKQLIEQFKHDKVKQGSHIANIQESDVRESIKKLKRRKAPGNDSIQNEHIIFGGEPVVKALTILFNSIMQHEIVPDAWKISIIIPIYKASGKPKDDPKSYRPIALLPCICKLFDRILVDRMKKAISNAGINLLYYRIKVLFQIQIALIGSLSLQLLYEIFV